MIRLGLTGGIGSGKTTVARIFESLGIPVYYADQRGRWLSDYAPEVILNIRAVFGDRVYREDGALDRKYLAEKVFTDRSLLEKLNGIIHPQVRRDYREWVCGQQEAPFTLMETAILFESGFDTEVQQVIVVTTPEELRIARTMQRDHADEVSVRARIQAQMPEQERLAKADYVLYADDCHLLIPQILELYRKLTDTFSG
ncbi:MAG: dephospho-CoA kinase [Rikenellaceae bacterium]|nr:dephospho-CoA kinase [Rikenellaceae bacterium]